MKKTLSLLITTALVAFSVNAQEQAAPETDAEIEIFDFNTMEARTTPGGIEIRVIQLPDTRMVQVTLEEGQITSMGGHTHAFDQMVVVQSGKIKAFSGEEEFILEAGQGFAVPPNVHHYYTALEDTVTVEVIGPGAPAGGGGMGGDGGMGAGGMGAGMGAGGMAPAAE